MQKKITKATVKAFLKKNDGKLFVKTSSRFDGMYDSVMTVDNAEFVPLTGKYDATSRNYGLGLWFTASTPNYCESYDNGDFTGYNVCNCCGSFTVAIKKTL